jgi:hypothetical protein
VLRAPPAQRCPASINRPVSGADADIAREAFPHVEPERLAEAVSALVEEPERRKLIGSTESMQWLEAAPR